MILLQRQKVSNDRFKENDQPWKCQHKKLEIAKKEIANNLKIVVLLKIRKSQKTFFLSSIPPKNQQNFYPISAPESKKWLNQKLKAIYFVKKRFFAALKKHAQTSHSFLHCFAVWAKSLLYHVFVFSSHASLLSQGKKKSLHQTQLKTLMNEKF